MRFKTRQGEVRIAHTTGHVAIVGEEFQELEERFHADAYSKGCISEGMAQVAPPMGAPFIAPLTPEERQEKILEAVKGILEEGDTENMTQAGVPKLDKVSAMVGFEATKAERDDAYNEVINIT